MKKWLYDFDVKKDVQKQVEKKSENDKGEEVTVTTTVTEQEPFTFSIQKATRKLYEEAELFYAVKLSEGIKAGLLTRPLLAKRYKNDGGAMSEPEKERYAEVYYQMLIKQEELEKLKLNLEGKTEESRARAASRLMADIIELQEEIQSFESQQSSLFDQTAENRAKNMTIMWWCLHLAHQENEGERELVFGGGDYDARLEVYDEIEDKNEAFWTEVVKKFAYFVTFWYLNGITSKEEFEQIENMYNEDVGFDPEESEEEESAKVEEEAKAEEAKAEEAKAEEPKAEEPKAEEPEAKAEEPEAEEPEAKAEEEKGPVDEEKAESRKAKKAKKNSARKPQKDVQESLEK
jgi:hypothetical protein